MYRLAAAEPVHGTPFHSWTCLCASVADVPVLMWARPLIPCGVPRWPLVLQWERWVPLGAPRPLCLLRRLPSLGHSCARLVSCLPLLWLILLMRGQALVQGVHPAYRLPSGGQLEEYPPRARRRWPSLWCWSTACTIFCGSLCSPIVDSSDS